MSSLCIALIFIGDIVVVSMNTNRLEEEREATTKQFLRLDQLSKRIYFIQTYFYLLPSCMWSAASASHQVVRRYRREGEGKKVSQLDKSGSFLLFFLSFSQAISKCFSIYLYIALHRKQKITRRRRVEGNASAASASFQLSVCCCLFVCLFVCFLSILLWMLRRTKLLWVLCLSICLLFGLLFYKWNSDRLEKTISCPCFPKR